MDAIFHEWGGMLLRWVHVITGIAWIGSSFYFMHVDSSLRAVHDIPEGKGGEAWEVHGGGFYQVRKYLLAPDNLPKELIWHKWESYSTWISGFALLCWVYYGQADLYLVDPGVRDLSTPVAILIGLGGLALGWLVYDALCKSPLANNEVALAAVGFAFVLLVAWGFQQVFSGRGAFIHTGAMLATVMTGNVFLVIIPNQKTIIADLLAGRAPNPALGKAGKIRSTHNNYITLPVLFLMISNHYPMSYSTPYAWVIVGLILVAGALVRVFYNLRHSGKGDQWWTWGAAAVLLWIAVWISMSTSPAGREALGLKPFPDRAVAALPALSADAMKHLEEATLVIQSRCSMCHAQTPVWQGIAIAPKGVVLESAADVHRWRAAIRVQAVMTHAMPPNNITRMERDERRVLAGWLAAK